MPIKYHYYDADPYIVTAINIKVNRLCNKYQLSDDDLEDLRQDLFVHVILYIHKFDSERSQWTTFIDRILKSGIANFLKVHFAKCRREENSVLLHEDVDNQEIDEYMTALDGTAVDNSTENIDLRVHIETTLPTLPPLYQRICQLLMEERSFVEIAHILKLPRTSLYFYLNQIRNILKKT